MSDQYTILSMQRAKYIQVLSVMGSAVVNKLMTAKDGGEIQKEEDKIDF